MISMKSKKVQTGLRLPLLLINQLKAKAKQEGKSFNAYVEEVLEKDAGLVFPKLRREDYPPDPELEALSLSLGEQVPPFTQEELDADPRLAHIWGEG